MSSQRRWRRLADPFTNSYTYGDVHKRNVGCTVQLHRPLLLLLLLLDRTRSSPTTMMKLNLDVGFVEKLPDWEGIKNAVLFEFDAYPSHDDGSIAPAVIRLGWHSAGTYDPVNMPR